MQNDLVTNIGLPTAIAFTPDGRLLITAQPGQLRVFQNGTLLATPALDLSSGVCANGERGLLGVAIDPEFSANR
ncbi:MAG TPA: PQQ-dependent sugar dehydrogenase, partial [Blastocatellia bacterium]